VKLLLEKGAELETKDYHGQTPLWWAAKNGHEAVVKLLVGKALRNPNCLTWP
jgi:ankyrin repeat protein